ncbi:class I SAM-dependent methyltransferase [Nitrosomonas sp. Is24]|uniref:class I SAM-dependent methyltransferase n=1 Tax=Nitrosomonas sp. Is24 TaxID=3080533 RepID=UPI00294AE7EF|nr:class I SAM-dependent methyltransferase [Nitrosomonas sp. Is24]MDV6340810.1 class I SAM-dependent methyltransferase [Nitrosomonas sp. Is24]
MIPDQHEFDPLKFYSSYPSKVIARPGYPARAQYKSTLLWNLYGKQILDAIGEIKTYADIGGCFGFGANALAYQIAREQECCPDTKVFETSPDFSKAGKILFPNIDFVNEDFTKWDGDLKRFDLVSLFDVIEHIPDPEPFLKAVSARTNFALLKTPMETTGEWRGSRMPQLQGALYEDGHVNFFDPSPYMQLLKRSGFEIVEWRLVPSIVPKGVAESILIPEDTPPKFARREIDVVRMLRRIIKVPLTLYSSIFRYACRIVGGGDYLCFVRLIGA